MSGGNRGPTLRGDRVSDRIWQSISGLPVAGVTRRRAAGIITPSTGTISTSRHATAAGVEHNWRLQTSATATHEHGSDHQNQNAHPIEPVHFPHHTSLLEWFDTLSECLLLDKTLQNTLGRVSLKHIPSTNLGWSIGT